MKRQAEPKHTSLTTFVSLKHPCTLHPRSGKYENVWAHQTTNLLPLAIKRDATRSPIFKTRQPRHNLIIQGGAGFLESQHTSAHKSRMYHLGWSKSFKINTLLNYISCIQFQTKGHYLRRTDHDARIHNQFRTGFLYILENLERRSEKKHSRVIRHHILAPNQLTNRTNWMFPEFLSSGSCTPHWRCNAHVDYILGKQTGKLDKFGPRERMGQRCHIMNINDH